MPEPQLFRREALDHRRHSYGTEGHPLQLSPRWLRRAYGLLLLVFVGAVLAVATVSIDTYAQGKAVVCVKRLGDGTAEPWILASFPGRHRPQLHPGLTLRVAMQDHPYTYRQVVVASVSDKILGVGATGRLLGEDVSEAILLDGPQVLVWAPLPVDDTVDDGGRAIEGMRGEVTVRLASRRLLTTLFPVLGRPGPSNG